MSSSTPNYAPSWASVQCQLPPSGNQTGPTYAGMICSRDDTQSNLMITCDSKKTIDVATVNQLHRAYAACQTNLDPAQGMCPDTTPSGVSSSTTGGLTKDVYKCMVQELAKCK